MRLGLGLGLGLGSGLGSGLGVTPGRGSKEGVGPVERQRPSVESEGAVRRAAQPVGEPRLLECSAHLLVLALETDP